MSDLLDRLDAWLKDQSDGLWEHSYGVTIESADNPGWGMDVDLVGTPLGAVPFEEVRFRESESSWYGCSRDATQWHGGGSLGALPAILSVFLDWAEAHRK